VTRTGRTIRSQFHRWFGERYPRFEASILSGAERFGNWKIVRPIPRWLGQSPQAFTLNLAETAAIYNVTFPFWVYLVGMVGLKEFYKRKYSLENLKEKEITIDEET